MTRVIERAVDNGNSMVCRHPDPFNVLAALVPAAAHIARIGETRDRYGGRSDRRVAVVTRDPRIRTIYRRLGIGSAPLHAVVPVINLSDAGPIARLGAVGATDGGTVFVRRAADLRRIGRVDLVVMDTPEEASPLALDVPTIYLVRHPDESAVVRLTNRVPTFALDADDLRRWSAAPAVIDGPILRETLGRLQNVGAADAIQTVPVKTLRDLVDFQMFWEDVGPLLRATERSAFGTALAQEAFALFYDLLHMAVPVQDYEAVFGRLSVRLRDIKNAARLVAGDVGELYLPFVAEELAGLAAALGPTPPKVEALADQVQEATRLGSVLVVARNAAQTALLEDQINRTAAGHRVSVSAYSGLSRTPPADVAILIGLTPRWARHLYHAGIARQVRVLTYAGTREQLDEQTVVRRTVAYGHRYGTWLARPAAKAHCLKLLTGQAPVIQDTEPSPPVVTVGDSRLEPSEPHPSVPPGLWDQVAHLRLWDEAAERDIKSGAGGTSEPAGSAPASYPLRVTFTDGRWVLLDAEDAVTTVDGTRSEVGYRAGSLRPGQRLFVIDGDSRKTLLSKVLEVAADVPELAVAAAWVEPWRRALVGVRVRFGTYEAFGEALRSHGCSVQTTQAVRLWCIGATIGPRNPADVRVVGEVVQDPVLRTHYRDVWAAMDTFRGTHTRLGQRLSALVREIGPAARAGDLEEDAMVDERSGLTVSDFRGCAEILEVAAIETIGDAVPTAFLGRLWSHEGSGD